MGSIRSRTGSFGLRGSSGSTKEGFWSKITNFAKKAGSEVVYRALLLYYVSSDHETPAWAKAIIYGALGYFILPIDAIPDLVPVLGFSDDLAALGSAVVAVASCTKESHSRDASEKLKEWFG